MRKYKIFVSGIQKELKTERRTIKNYIQNDVLLAEHFSVFLFEDIPAKSKPSEQLYLSEVDKCDIYFGVFGNKYGVTKKTESSPTEKEFREAEARNKEILIFIKGRKDLNRDKRMRKLIGEIRNSKSGHSYDRFADISELKNSIYESLIEFLRDRGRVGKIPFDKTACDDARYSEIDKQLILSVVSRDKFPIAKDAKIKDILIHLNLLNNNKLTNSAVLLFGKNPHKYHLQAEIKCIQLEGMAIEKPFVNYQIYSGNLFEQIDRAVAFVVSCLKAPVIQQKGTARVKRPLEIPRFAIHEAIVNAIAHRDYNSNAAVQVWVFVDRIEVWNPGRLSRELSIDLLKKPHASYPTNPLVAHVLYLSDYIQKAGSGTLEMIKQYKKRRLSEPRFETTRSEFKAILPRDISRKRSAVKDTVRSTAKDTVKITQNQNRIMKEMDNNRYITAKELSKIVDINERNIKTNISKLKKIGLIKRIGADKSGYWELIVK